MERTNGLVALFDFDDTLFHLGTDWAALRADLERLAVASGADAARSGIFELTRVLDAGALADAAELAGLDTGSDLVTGQALYRHYAESGARIAVVTHNGRAVVEEFFRRSDLPPPRVIFDREALETTKSEAADVVRGFVDHAAEVVLVGDSAQDRRLAAALGARFVAADDPLVTHYDRKARELDELAATYESADPYKRVFYGLRFEAVMRALAARPGDEILEVGAGSGYYTRALLAAGARVVATDVSAAYLEQARRIAPAADYRVEDAEKLSLPAERFDRVLMTEVIEHLAHPEKAVDEVARVLRPRGVLAVSTPSRFSPMNLAYGLKRRVRRYGFNEHLHEFTPRQFVRLIERQFEIQSLEFVNFLLPYPLDAAYLRLGSPGADAVPPLDRALGRIPVVRRAGWTMVARARKRW